MSSDPITEPRQEPGGSAPRWGWSEVALGGWALALAVLVLGPALGWGYVLSYDMVWVPDLALRSDFLGVASGLPRAVPSDAVVSVLDEVVPGMLLQKLVLMGALVGAGLGCARLVRSRPLVVRMVAVTLAVWNPFVVERLVIGHWPVLVGYAVVPWLVLAVRGWSVTGRLPLSLLVLVPLGCLNASAGVATAVVLLALAADRHRWWKVLLLAAAGNLPWVLSGLLHTASATTDALGAQAFALHDEGGVPGPLAALSLGGIWNGEVVPDSRTGALGWVTLVAVVGLAVTGLVRGGWSTSTRERNGLVLCWVVGWGLAVLSWGAPDAIGALAAHVPGGGLVRDGGRLLVLCLPLALLLVVDGFAAIWDRLPAQQVSRVALAVAFLLAPVALMPDAAWGAAGRLHAVDFPDEWSAARSVVSLAHEQDGGDVLLLPASSYRQPVWNRGTKVFDPLGRFLTPDYVASDVLVVSGSTLAGEDPRVRDALAALGEPTPGDRSRALAREGIGIVATERDAAGARADVAGEVLLDGPLLRVVAVPGATSSGSPVSWEVVMAVAWVGYVAPIALAVWLALAALGRRRTRRLSGPGETG